GIWLARLVAEQDNLRAVLYWALREGADRTLGLRLAGCLGHFWTIRGQYREGRQWLLDALAPLPAPDPALRAAALIHAGNLVYWLGDFAQAQVEYEEALSLWRAGGDPARVARALLSVGNIAFEQAEYDKARSLYEEALAIEKQIGDRHTRVRILNNLGAVSAALGDHVGALALYEECVKVWEELGDRWSFAQQLTNIGDVASIVGAVERARDCFRRSLTMRRELDDREGIRETMHSLGFLAHQVGESDRATRLLAAAARLGEHLEWVLDAERQALYDRHVAGLQTTLGQEPFNAAWAEGHAMEYRQAIDYALGAGA
ncbi:MAG: tetratricopeptide repeat protein, partial [Chloroflexota bacterium]